MDQGYDSDEVIWDEEMPLQMAVEDELPPQLDGGEEPQEARRNRRAHERRRRRLMRAREMAEAREKIVELEREVRWCQLEVFTKEALVTNIHNWLQQRHYRVFALGSEVDRLRERLQEELEVEALRSLEKIKRRHYWDARPVPGSHWREVQPLPASRELAAAARGTWSSASAATLPPPLINIGELNDDSGPLAGSSIFGHLGPPENMPDGWGHVLGLGAQPLITSQQGASLTHGSSVSGSTPFISGEV